MSYQTTMARAEAAAAESAWRAHLRDCATCSAASRSRKPAATCPAGRQLDSDRRGPQAELARQCQLDTAPIDGQGELWPTG